MKKNKLIEKYIENILLFFIKKLKPYTLYSNGDLFYILYFLLTRILLLLVFIIDVFYFQQIKYTYIFILLGLINLLIVYLLYSIKIIEMKYFEILKHYLIEITSKDDDNADYYLDPSTISYDNHVKSEFDKSFKYLEIEHFVDLQSTAIIFDDTPYRYICFHKSQRQDIISFSTEKYILLPEHYF